MAPISLCSLLAAGDGVPANANMPHQIYISYPGTVNACRGKACTLPLLVKARKGAAIREGARQALGSYVAHTAIPVTLLRLPLIL